MLDVRSKVKLDALFFMLAAFVLCPLVLTGQHRVYPQAKQAEDQEYPEQQAKLSHERFAPIR